VSKFFIEIYLDENVHALIAKIIRSHGFKATTTHDAGRKGASDAEQLEYANEQGFVILTHDRTDFEKLAAEYFVSGKNHCGIIIIADNPPQEIARRMLSILNDFTADEMKNQIIYI
jgi:predicted nuclease of predicted toxin-antitoxin system